MVVRGKVVGGVVVLENGASIPDGADVTVEFADGAKQGTEELKAVLLRHAGKGRNLPPDLAAQHDHYAHGTPKR